MLTADEIDRYNCDGYVIPEGFCLNNAVLKELRVAVDTVLESNPEILPDRIINPHLNGGRPYGVNGHPSIDMIVRNPQILEMVEAVLGPNIILWLSHLFCKQPKSVREVPWHQDGQYWPIRPWATCTVWIAIDKVKKANGAMKVIPGSHKNRGWRHHEDVGDYLTLNQVIGEDQLIVKDMQYIELEPGQCSLHDVGIVHGSAANMSNHRRAGLAIRYMPATSGLHRDNDMPLSKFDWSTLPIELIKGKNYNPVNDFKIGHVAAPW
ncbi:MAG: phytanoyl-CoA dioxygenase [Myxococcales bacterium]|nr:phytanoyl-CoA dioxygenase [Myxococcales bacterium]